MRFDTTKYAKTMLITESNNFPAIRQRIAGKYTTLTNTLNEFVQLTEKLDKLKKEIFYGKGYEADEPNEVVGLENLYTDVNIRAAHAVLGIATESGEMVDALLKLVTGDMSFEDYKVNSVEERGDISWYVNIHRDAVHGNEEVDKNANMNKLLVKRYGLAFDEDKANNRNLEEELKVLANPDEIIPEQFIGTSQLEIGDLFQDNSTECRHLFSVLYAKYNHVILLPVDKEFVGIEPVHLSGKNMFGSTKYNHGSTLDPLSTSVVNPIVYDPIVKKLTPRFSFVHVTKVENLLNVSGQ